MEQINFKGNIKYYSIIPVLLYISITELKPPVKLLGTKIVMIGIHITPWLGFHISTIKEFVATDECSSRSKY